MMRLIMIVLATLWLSACASAVSSGYGQGGQNTDGRSYAEARADNELKARVTATLVRDSLVPAMNVDVRCLNGVITLGGEVPSTEAARRAERLAARVRGVKQVNNRLRVAN